MSVLYKALQKAEKENELRQSASSESSFDPRRLAASGALKAPGAGRGQSLKQAGLAAAVVIVVGGGSAFLLLREPPPQPATLSTPAGVGDAPMREAVMQPPAPSPTEGGEAPSLTAAAEGNQVATVPSATIVSPAADVPAEASVHTPPADARETADAAAQAPVAPAPGAPASSAEAPMIAAVASAAKPQPRQSGEAGRRGQGPATIPVNSPARMLSPPVTISRAEFGLSGVGEQVQVREVSQAARSNVAAGYDALIRGSYDMALGFYDNALKDEPNSVLGLLGRGAALQKMGRGQEAQTSYEQVLKLDPENREALTNMTAIVGERSPQDALNRLLELEREYATFSPIKAQIGLTYAKLGSYQQALDYLRRAAVLTPGAVMYHYNMALVLDHLGWKEQAAATYEQVLAWIAGGRGSSELSAVDIERRVRFLRAR